MKKKQIIEAWRDEDYYLSLSDEERSAVPGHPAGITGLEDAALKSVTGGCGTTKVLSACTPCPGRNCAA